MTGGAASSDGMIELLCDQCGLPHRRPPRFTSHRNFCSNECKWMNISDAEFVRRVANLARQITPLLDARAGKYALTAQEREEQELCRARFGWHDPTSPPQLAYKRSLRQKRSEVA